MYITREYRGDPVIRYSCQFKLKSTESSHKTTWVAEGATKSHPKVIHTSPRGELSHEEHLQMRGFPRRHGEDGWVLREILRFLFIVAVMGWRGPSVAVGLVDGTEVVVARS